MPPSILRRSRSFRQLNLPENGQQDLLAPIQIDFEPLASSSTVVTAFAHSQVHFWGHPRGLETRPPGESTVRRDIRQHVRICPSMTGTEDRARARGRASFRTEAGEIEVDMKYGSTANEDRPAVELFLESGRGDIMLRIPRSFVATGNILVYSAGEIQAPGMELTEDLGVVWVYPSPSDLSYHKFCDGALSSCGSNVDTVIIVAWDGTVIIDYVD